MGIMGGFKGKGGRKKYLEKKMVEIPPNFIKTVKPQDQKDQ